MSHKSPMIYKVDRICYSRAKWFSSDGAATCAIFFEVDHE